MSISWTASGTESKVWNVKGPVFMCQDNRKPRSGSPSCISPWRRLVDHQQASHSHYITGDREARGLSSDFKIYKTRVGDLAPHFRCMKIAQASAKLTAATTVSVASVPPTP